MGRPGTGGGGGGSFGGHSSGRSSGGHHVGGTSSRPGTSRSSSSNSYNHYGPTFVGGGFGYRPYMPRGGPSTAIIILIILLTVSLISSFSGKPKSTRNREKLNNQTAYTNDCIQDELGYIEEPSKLSRGLQHFYEKTGVQPYIVMKKYDPSLTSDTEKENFSRQYYENNIDNEGTFLYMYFEDQNPNDVGYMTYVNGKKVSSVMDEEAVEIFWNYIDRYWVDDGLTMTQVFDKAFNQTADTIMTKSTTGMDVIKYIVIGVFVIGAGVILIIIRKQKRKHDAEKAAETERILRTPLDEGDDILKKYNK